MRREDPTTEAIIEVSDSPQSVFGGIGTAAASVLDQSGISAAVAALGYASTTPTATIVNTVKFSYSSDVLQLGDPFSVVIPNPRGQYSGKFLRGQTIKLSLRNPNVNDGRQTLKCLGIIVERTSTIDRNGSVIQLECADLGWHLLQCDAPLWYRLSSQPNINEPVALYDLLTNPDWIDPSWGFRGISADNETNKLLKQSVNNGRVEREIALRQALGVLTWIQVEPGTRIADYLTTYARRLGRLINVSCDGYIQVWKPNYDQEPRFAIELHDLGDSSRNRNNVLEVRVTDSCEDIYTEVACISEIVGYSLTDPNLANQNWAKRRGTVKNRFALPFFRRLSFAEGDLYETETATQQAKWRYDRGVFDSWSAEYVVRGHWQRPNNTSPPSWWESDWVCSVSDSLNGLFGNFYISSVRCDRDERGDITTVTLRKPYLLQASFGPYPLAPVQKDSIVDYSASKHTDKPGSIVVEAK